MSEQLEHKDTKGKAMQGKSHAQKMLAALQLEHIRVAQAPTQKTRRDAKQLTCPR